MNQELTDIHKIFADFFPDERIRPYAYLLSKKLQEGHICIAENAPLEQETGAGYTMNKIPDFSQMNKMVSVEENDLSLPIIYSRNRLYFQRYYRYETSIAGKIKELVLRSRHLSENRKAEIESLKDRLVSLSPSYPVDGLLPIEKTDWQLVAVIQALLNDFSIITGGPGTGKTTTLANLLHMILLLNSDATIALAAPTGKASMRMRQSLLEKSGKFSEQIRNRMNDLRASTIHSLLGYKKNSIYFKHNESNQLPYDWIIIDEASMIDVPLFSKLITSISEKTRIVLLGDKDQLASVEAGSLLGDLCQSLPSLNRFSAEQISWFNQFIPDQQRIITNECVRKQDEQLSLLQNHIIELKLSHRFQERGRIGQLSKAIIHSKKEDLQKYLQDEHNQEVAFIKNGSDEALKNFIKDYADYLKEPNILSAIQKFNKLRVLVTVKQGPSGLYDINKKVEKFLSDEFGQYISADRPFYFNRPVMVTRNNQELGLFNGDIGIVRYDDQRRLRVWFQSEDAETGLRSFLPSYLTDCETVFAMTIHKSQGSEFDNIFVILPDQADNRLLTRELIYTGITRARTKVMIQGSEEVILSGMASSVERSSGLQLRLNE